MSIKGEFHSKVIENIFNKISEETFQHVWKERLIWIREAYRMADTQDQKINPLHHVIVKTWNIGKTKSLCKALRK